MFFFYATLIVGLAGLAVSLWSGFSSHKGRMREDPPGSGLYTIPKGGGLGLTIAAAVIGLVGLGLTIWQAT